jgi:protein N-terminal asparagine amidohydrolase
LNLENISIIGTEDTTTCCIGVLRHTGSGVVCLAHFDGSALDKLEHNVENMIKRIEEVNMSLALTEGHFQLHLIGGFNDSRGYSEELALQLLCN